jgi:hypothetical protein
MARRFHVLVLDDRALEDAARQEHTANNIAELQVQLEKQLDLGPLILVQRDLSLPIDENTAGQTKENPIIAMKKGLLPCHPSK